MSPGPDHARTSWTIGSIRLERVPYFDVPLPAESIGLDGVADTTDWAGPWLSDGQPTVGQAFWIIRVDDRTIVVDPCGASDQFLRSGPDAVAHQVAAFDLLRAAGCDPEEVDEVVLTHLDGIGMAALADGAPEAEETWTPAFPGASIVISDTEHDYVIAGSDELSGARAFAQLDALGVVRPVATPHEPAPGVSLRLTGAHSPGHCRIDIASEGERAVLVGHLAISPLHAAAGISPNHRRPAEAWTAFREVLDLAVRDGSLVSGSLWPAPGVARVTAPDPYVLTPANV